MKRESVYITTAMGLLLSLMSCSTPNYNRSELEKYELKGEVKTLVIKKHETFMQNGKMIKGNLTDSTIIQFYPDGRLDEIIDYRSETLLNGEKSYLNTKRVYKYKYTATKTTCNHSCSSNDYNYNDKEVIYYNDCGGIEKDITYGKNGKENSRYEYTYNDEHQLIEKAYYSNGELYSKKKYIEYNEKGLCKKTSDYGSDGELWNVVYYDYDDEGRKINIYCKANYESYSYNYEGYVSYFSSGTSSRTLHYDNNYEYEYDSKGNYVVKYCTRTTYYHGYIEEVNRSIEEREITYY